MTDRDPNEEPKRDWTHALMIGGMLGGALAALMGVIYRLSKATSY